MNDNIFRLLRIAHDMSVSEVAASAQLSASFVRAIENGEKQPTVKTVNALAQVYHMKGSDILALMEDTETVTGYENRLMRILMRLADSKKV